MSKIARATQKLFGSSGSTSDFGEFGSKAAGAPATTKSPATIQALSAFLTGWTAATVAQDRPYLEDMNSLFLLAFQQIAYCLQAGVPEWDAGTTYYTGSIVNDGTGILYKSLADDNLNHAVTDTDYWENVVPPITTGGSLGSYKNLKVTRPSVTTVTVTADELVLEDSSNGKVTVRALSETADIATSGAGGLDTGSEAADAWYYVWIIRKSSDGTVNVLLSASATSPTLPSGYDQKALVSAVHNTSGDFVNFTQQDKKYRYAEWIGIASGGSLGAWTTISCATVVPSALSSFITGHFGTDAGVISLTNDAGTAFGQAPGRNKYYGHTAYSERNYFEFDFLTDGEIYFSAQTGTVMCSGFDINKL